MSTTFLAYAGRISRPVAYVLFARLHGAAALGLVVLELAWLELGMRAATLGLDRALQRSVPATDERQRPALVARALLLATAAGLLLGATSAAVLPAAPLTRLSLLLGLPALTVGVTAIHALPGARQIATLAWARSVIEPGVFLVVGSALALVARGEGVLLAAMVASLASVLVVGLVGLQRELGFMRLVRALGEPGGPGYVALLRRAFPLGATELLNLALERGDVIAVGWILHSPALVSGYAIASDLAGALSKLRQGFDQAFAPLAAELHANGRTGELTRAARLSTRWCAALAAPLVLLLLAFPGTALSMFRVHESSIAPSLILLVLGRLADVAAGPAPLVLGMLGHSRLVLLDGLLGLVVTTAGGRLLGALLGAPGVALAAAAGIATASLLAVMWLRRVERRGEVFL